MGSKDADLFKKGRRCETQNLGIGAFSYYRRVVENKKDAIFDAIIAAAERVRFGKIDDLRAGRMETQFARGMELAKDAMPQALLIKGHNPLTLLHSALSEGLHAESDEDCLQYAQAIRVILAELAERISVVMKDDTEITHALTTLLHRHRD